MEQFRKIAEALVKIMDYVEIGEYEEQDNESSAYHSLTDLYPFKQLLLILTSGPISITEKVPITKEIALLLLAPINNRTVKLTCLAELFNFNVNIIKKIDSQLTYENYESLKFMNDEQFYLTI